MKRNSLWKHVRTLVSFISGGYSLALLAYVATRLLPSERRWWLALMDSFATWYFLPLLVLFPLALVTRAKRGALLMMPALAIALGWIAPYYAPKARAQTDAPTLRVITQNTWGANTSFSDGAAYNQVASWLRETDADIVLLQEIPYSQRQRDDGILGLRDVYPQQISSDVQAWTCAMLTRLPVVESASYEPDPGISRPRYQRMVVDFNEQLIAVYNVHIRFPIFAPRRNLPVSVPYVGMFLGYDERERNDEIRYLLRLLEQERLPYVVGGDFNMSDQSLMHAEVAAQMRDSFREAGMGLGTSWPVSVARGDLLRWIPPLIRIDYLWHSAGLRAVTAVQAPPLGSDHLGLVVELAVIR